MQNREKEKDINWNDSQFTRGSNWTGGCGGCSWGRLLCKGRCEEAECTYMRGSDTDTKTRDPARALNNSSAVKLMLGEAYSSGLSGGQAIHTASPAGRVEEEAECRDGGVHVGPHRCRLVCVCVCARRMGNAYTEQLLTQLGRHVFWWDKYVLNRSA